MATVIVNSKITIGAFKPFKGLNDVHIKKSIGEYLDTAILKLPLTARLKQSGEIQTQSVMTSSQFKRGDMIKIELGYEYSGLKTEFQGFISRINMTEPLEIECEGYAFQLRDKTINKSWKETTLIEVLTYLIQDTDIVLKEVDDIVLSDLTLINETGFSALGKIKEGLGGTVNIWMEGYFMNAGFRHTFFTKRNNEGKSDVFYKLGYNTVDAKQLKLRTPKEKNIVYVAYKKQKDGKAQDQKTSGGGDTQRLQVQNAGDDQVLKQVASEKEYQDNYKGWEGKIETMLVPYCRPGYKMKIEDKRYPERSGNYLVEAVETKFGVGGARRTVEISFEL